VPPPLPIVEPAHLDQLWFQVGGTRCNLTCRHCFIRCSPHNDSFRFLTLAEVQQRLQESAALGVKEYYFTGGEPFLNPDLVAILCETLRYGPATVLTNATLLPADGLDRLRAAERQSLYSLEFRVSIDGFSPETNDPIRGRGTFERALGGVSLLVERGFLPIVTAARSWPPEREREVVAHFIQALQAAGYARPRLKILPTLQIGAEIDRGGGYRPDERVTAAMLADYDSSQLVCHHSRCVSDRGVHVCPILIEEPDSLLGQSLAESLRPYAIRHGACYTCYQHGAICSNASSIVRPSEAAT
jgi:MoaA/NifB/PqqE/SkfB family radical SAM enzyme